MLEIACTQLQAVPDEYEILGKNWANEIRKVSADQQMHAKKSINDILNGAQLGTLHRYSISINQTCSETPTSTYSRSSTPQSTSMPMHSSTPQHLKFIVPNPRLKEVPSAQYGPPVMIRHNSSNAIGVQILDQSIIRPREDTYFEPGFKLKAMPESTVYNHAPYHEPTAAEYYSNFSS